MNINVFFSVIIAIYIFLFLVLIFQIKKTFVHKLFTEDQHIAFKMR